MGISSSSGSLFTGTRRLATYDFVTDAGVADSAIESEMTLTGYALTNPGSDGFQSIKKTTGYGLAKISLYPDDYKGILIHLSLGTSAATVTFKKGINTVVSFVINTTSFSSSYGDSASFDQIRDVTISNTFIGEELHTKLLDPRGMVLAAFERRSLLWTTIDSMEVTSSAGNSEIFGIDVYSEKKDGYTSGIGIERYFLDGDVADETIYTSFNSILAKTSAVSSPMGNISAYFASGNIISSFIEYPGYFTKGSRVGTWLRSDTPINVDFQYTPRDWVRFDAAQSKVWRCSTFNGSGIIGSYGSG